MAIGLFYCARPAQASCALSAPSDSAAPKRGGSPLGIHFLSDYSDCPTKWYWRNLALWPGVIPPTDPSSPISADPLTVEQGNARGFPPPEGLPIGIESAGFAPALDTGSRVHAGLAAWYLSGCRDGEDSRERSVSAALDAARLDPLISGDEPTEAIAESLALTDKLLTGYAEFWKDEPVFVAHDPISGEPLVEREFWLDLGYRGYCFTARCDLTYWSGAPHSGYLRFMEHKTARASDLPRWLKRAELDGQFTGQYLIGASHFPSLPFDAVTLNVLVKDRSAKSKDPAFARRSYARTPSQLEKFRLDLVRRLKRIDEATEEWRDLVGRGMEPDDAAKIVFDGTPSGYECVGTGIACTFASLCANRERASRLLLDSYQPRHYKYEWENPLRVQRKE